MRTNNVSAPQHNHLEDDSMDNNFSHWQLMVENSTALATGKSGLEKDLSAYIICSLLFHSHLNYLDNHIVNNPTLYNAMKNYRVIKDSLKIDGVNVFISNKFTDLAQYKIEQVNKRKTAHPGFEHTGDSDDIMSNYESLDKFYEELSKNINTKTYTGTDLSESFSNLIIEMFESSYASKEFGDENSKKIADILRVLREKNGSIGQSDFELVGKRADFKMANVEYAMNIAGIHSIWEYKRNEIWDVVRYCRRRAPSFLNKDRMIMPHEQTDIHNKIFYSGKYDAENLFDIKSEYFFADNIVQLEISDIEYLRHSDEFIHFQKCIKNYNHEHQYEEKKNIEKALIEYINRIDDRIKNKLSFEKKLRWASRNIKVGIFHVLRKDLQSSYYFAEKYKTEAVIAADCGVIIKDILPNYFPNIPSFGTDKDTDALHLIIDTVPYFIGRATLEVNKFLEKMKIDKEKNYGKKIEYNQHLIDKHTFFST